MSNTSKLIIAFIVGAFCAVSFQRLTVGKQKAIVMPEEINEAIQGDTLKVCRVSVDTIYLEFNNLRNR